QPRPALDSAPQVRPELGKLLLRQHRRLGVLPEPEVSRRPAKPLQDLGDPAVRAIEQPGDAAARLAAVEQSSYDCALVSREPRAARHLRPVRYPQAGTPTARAARHAWRCCRAGSVAPFGARAAGPGRSWQHVAARTR